MNKKLEEVIMKTVAAFANSHGGTLLIGVDDDGDVLGPRSRLQLAGRADRDSFELHLRNLLSQQFGPTFVTSKVAIKFHAIEGQGSLPIETLPAKEP